MFAKHAIGNEPQLFNLLCMILSEGVVHMICMRFENRR